VLEGIGVKHIYESDTYQQAELVAQALADDTFSVVIARHPCMLKFMRAQRKKPGFAPRAVAIDQEECRRIHEALRGMNSILKEGGTLVYYDVVWQPLDVRLKKRAEVSADTIRDQGEIRGIKIVKAFKKDLTDARMQNIVLLAYLDGRHLIPGVDTGHFRQAMDDLMIGGMLEQNMALFEEVRAGQAK